MMDLLTFLLTLFAISITRVNAADNDATNASSSVFVYTNPQNNQDFVFALNVAQDTGDLYMHMSCPSGNSWMGVGVGSQMKDALIFVAYASSNGTGVTLSPRVATGHNEPSYDDNIKCDLIYGDEYADGNTVTTNGYEDLDGVMTLNAVCHNATEWAGGLLPTGGNGPAAMTEQPFIFAVGPGLPMQSDSLTASMRRHSFYGQFTMDMTKAASKIGGQVPLPNGGNNTYVLSDASAATNTKQDNDPAPAIHAFVMSFVFVVVYPAGALVLRMLNRVKLHAIMQSIGLVLTCMGTAGGIVISTLYNKSKHFQSGHQVIGILLLLALFTQLGLGIMNHRTFKQTGQGTKLGQIHKYLGPAILLVGIINAPIGFVFAGNAHLCLPYIIILLMFVIIYCTIRFASKLCCGRRMARNKNANAPRTHYGGGSEGYEHPQFGNPSGAAPGAGGPYMHPPPAYGRQPYERQPSNYGQTEQDVPLRPYDSQTSGISGLGAQHPRPMI